MDGPKKKRKIEGGEDNTDDDEEEEMEQFFALIKSTREVRDRIAAAENRGKSAGDKAAGTWNPTFRVDDFMEAPPEKAADADRSGPLQGNVADEKASTTGGDNGLDLDLYL